MKRDDKDPMQRFRLGLWAGVGIVLVILAALLLL